MPPSTNHTEYKRNLPSALEREAVAFRNSGGGTFEIMKPQTFSREAAKARSSGTPLNLKTETDRIMKTELPHLIPSFFSSCLRAFA